MEEKEKTLIKCPCCGKLTLEPPVKIKDEELDLYTACILTGEPYKKTYSLYNGLLEITVTGLTDEIKEKMNLLTSKFTFIENEEAKDMANLFIVRLFTLLPIVTITKKAPDREPETTVVQSNVLPILDEAFSHLQDKGWLEKHYKMLLDSAFTCGITKTVLDKVCAQHLRTVELLQDNGFDENFFTGIVQS